MSTGEIFNPHSRLKTQPLTNGMVTDFDWVLIEQKHRLFPHSVAKETVVDHSPSSRQINTQQQLLPIILMAALGWATAFAQAPESARNPQTNKPSITEANASATSLGTTHSWNWSDQGRPTGGTIVIDASDVLGAITVMDTPNASQRPYAFVRGGNGHLWTHWWNGSRWDWSDQGLPPGVDIRGTAGVVTVKDTPNAGQRPYVFVKGSDGHLWVHWWSGSRWDWSDQGLPAGATTTEVDDVLGVTTVMDTPTAGQRPYVFVKGSDGHLWVHWWSGSRWNWSDQGLPPGVGIRGTVGVVTVKDTPNAAQRPYVFVRGSDGHLWVHWWSGSRWDWSDQGLPTGTTLSRVSDVLGVTTVMDTPNASQRPYAFVRGSDGHLWVHWWSGSRWYWSDQGLPPGTDIRSTAGVLTVKDTPNASQRPYAFVRGSDGHLWVHWWNGSRWYWSDQGIPAGAVLSGTDSSLGVITVMDTPSASQRPYIFVRGSDGHLWVHWWY